MEVGDVLADDNNLFTVLDYDCRSSHFINPTHYLVECTEGPRKGTRRWVSKEVAKMFCEGKE